MKDGCFTLVIESHMKHIAGYGFDFGWGQGYVLLPDIHPFYGVDYDDLYINIHGGLTFGKKFESDHFLEWIKDVEIDGDVNVENFKDFDNYWIIGFDTGHYNDSLFNCPKSYVLSETNRLLDQCISDNVEGIKKYRKKYIIDIRRKKLQKISIIDKRNKG